jgi:carbonic anhydrase/acetyltransferase-like protein (isoleucine patch superfamily)
MTAISTIGRSGLFSFNGKAPRVADDVFIAPGAMVIGDVEIGPGSSVWFNVVIRADCNSVRIGAGTNIQDGAVLHVDPDAPLTIGDEVTVGHGAIVHGTTIGDRVLIGMGAVILSRSSVGNEALIAAGAVVPEDARIGEGMLAAGVPAREKRALDERNRGLLTAGADHYRAYSRQFRAGLDPVEEE